MSITRGDKHDYLGMQLTMLDDYYDLDMYAYLEKLLQGRTEEPCACHNGANMMEDPSDSDEILSDADQKVFHSDFAKVLYIAKRVRQMMMPLISVLAGRANKATAKDMSDLSRGFGYLIYSRDLKMRYKCGGSVKVDVYVDASWAVHDDCHGRSGIVVMLDGCSVGSWTVKQKIITRNSTESELVALLMQLHT